MSIDDVHEYLNPIIRWWWLILLSTLVAIISSFLFVLNQPLVYRSQTTIMIGGGVQSLNPSNQQFGLAEQLASTYADIAGRAPVRHATMIALGLERLPTYTVKAVMDSPLIEIAVTDPDPALAQAVAQEIVRQLILQSPAGQLEQERQEFITDQIVKLEASIQETEDEIAQRQNELTGLFSAREIAAAQDQIVALQNKLSSLRVNYSSMLANSQQNAVNRITILEPAALPQRPINSNPMVSLLMAAVVGAVLGGATAYVLEFLDSSIRNGAEIRARLAVTLLAEIPDFRLERKQRTLYDLPPHVTESYRGLCLNLLHLDKSQSTGVLVLTGPSVHDGKSITAASISVLLARSGRKVILVDADLYRPRQHWLFQISNTIGLSTLLTGDAPRPEEALQTTLIPNLRVLPSGRLPDMPSELLGSERIKDLLATLSTMADHVILDTPPLDTVVDAAVIGMQAHGVLLVMRANKTTWNQATNALEKLKMVGISTVGVILNGVSKPQSTYGGGYGYGLQPPERKSPRTIARKSKVSALPGTRPASSRGHPTPPEQGRTPLRWI